MVAQGLRETRLTPEEYLEMERHSQIKHEYIAGQIYEMAANTDVHNLIMGNLVIALRTHLRGTQGRVFFIGFKLHLTAVEAFYYPDVMVSFEQAPDCYYREQPVLVAEILSVETAQRDRGEKWRDYQTLPSLKEYMLVSQDSMDVRVFRRDESGDWKQHIYTDGMRIALLSVDLEIPIEQVYEEVWE